MAGWTLFACHQWIKASPSSGVCVCERERERERQRESISPSKLRHHLVPLQGLESLQCLALRERVRESVCVRERERVREREKSRQRTCRRRLDAFDA